MSTGALLAMARGGIHDQIGGGFARYAVDSRWIVPHFEKMLSDQALLALVYLRADRAMGGGTPWRAVALDTLEFVRTDLRLPLGFASSLDADSNGEEGAHTTWTPDEVKAALEAAGLHERIDDTLYRYELHGDATFEGRYIPQLAPGVPFATPAEFVPVRAALCAVRALRPQPGRDDKVILEWNAMTAVALFEAFEPILVNEALQLLGHGDRLEKQFNERSQPQGGGSDEIGPAPRHRQDQAGAFSSEANSQQGPVGVASGEPGQGATTRHPSAARPAAD
jgi:uncharacterized protein YyaL (SSP411 family)